MLLTTVRLSVITTLILMSVSCRTTAPEIQTQPSAISNYSLVYTDESFDFIVDAVEFYRSRLNNTEVRLKNYKKNNPNANSDNDSEFDERIVEQNVDFNKAFFRNEQLSHRRKIIEQTLNSNFSNTNDGNEKKQQQSRISEIQSQIELLRLSFTDEYPEIVALKKRIAGMSAANEEPSTSSTNEQKPQLSDELKQLEKAEASQLAMLNEKDAILNKTMKEFNKLDSKDVFGKIERDRKIMELTYEYLLQEQEYARVKIGSE